MKSTERQHGDWLPDGVQVYFGILKCCAKHHCHRMSSHRVPSREKLASVTPLSQHCRGRRFPSHRMDLNWVTGFVNVHEISHTVFNVPPGDSACKQSVTATDMLPSSAGFEPAILGTEGRHVTTKSLRQLFSCHSLEAAPT